MFFEQRTYNPSPTWNLEHLGGISNSWGLAFRVSVSIFCPNIISPRCKKKCQLRGTSSAYVNWPQSNLQMGSRSQQFKNYTHRTLPKANNKRPLKETAIPCHSTPKKKKKKVVFQLSTTNLCAGVNFGEGNCAFLHPIEARCWAVVVHFHEPANLGEVTMIDISLLNHQNCRILVTLWKMQVVFFLPGSNVRKANACEKKTRFSPWKEVVHDFGKKNLKDFVWILLDGLPEIHQKSGQFLQRFHETINQNHPENHPSLGWGWMNSTVKNAEQKVANVKWLIGFQKKHVHKWWWKKSCTVSNKAMVQEICRLYQLLKLKSGEKTASHNPGSAGKKKHSSVL